MTVGILVGIAVTIGFILAHFLQQSRAKFEGLVKGSTGHSQRVTLFDERSSWDAGYYVMAFFICLPSVICSFLHADIPGTFLLALDVVVLAVIGYTRHAMTAGLRLQYDMVEKEKETSTGALVG